MENIKKMLKREERNNRKFKLFIIVCLLGILGFTIVFFIKFDLLSAIALTLFTFSGFAIFIISGISSLLNDHYENIAYNEYIEQLKKEYYKETGEKI